MEKFKRIRRVAEEVLSIYGMVGEAQFLPPAEAEKVTEQCRKQFQEYLQQVQCSSTFEELGPICYEAVLFAAPKNFRVVDPCFSRQAFMLYNLALDQQYGTWEQVD